MKTLRKIFGNLWVLPGLVACGVSVAVVWRNPSFGHAEVSGVALMALLFRLATQDLSCAWARTKKPFGDHVHPRGDRLVAELERVRRNLGNRDGRQELMSG